jgi:hypothetical protein
MEKLHTVMREPAFADDIEDGTASEIMQQCHATGSAVNDLDVQPSAGSLAASAGSAMLRLQNSSCSMAPPQQLAGQQDAIGAAVLCAAWGDAEGS